MSQALRGRNNDREGLFGRPLFGPQSDDLRLQPNRGFSKKFRQLQPQSFAPPLQTLYSTFKHSASTIFLVSQYQIGRMGAELSPSPEVQDQLNPGDELIETSDAASVCESLTPSAFERREAELDREDAEAEALLYRKIEKLCKALWPPSNTLRDRFATTLRKSKIFRSMLSAPEDIQIMRTEGGDLNHITMITLPSRYATKVGRDLVLRNPRHAYCNPKRDVGILKYVRTHTTIPVATVVDADFTSDNPLESPYLLQRRVAGTALAEVLSTLSQKQRCQIAKQLGRITRQLFALESPVAGLIEATPSPDTQGTETFRIIPFGVTDRGKSQPLQDMSLYDAPPTTDIKQSTADLLLSQYERWRLLNIDWPNELDLWDRLIATVREMSHRGFFDHRDLQMHCLCHVDLHMGNIMVQTSNHDDSATITGILDWDEACFAPKFVNCMPPAWLWMGEDGYEALQTDEEGGDPWPYEMPGAESTSMGSKEDEEVKRCFEEEVGEAYKCWAYEERFRIARCLFRIAKEGVREMGHVKAGERIMEGWEGLRGEWIRKDD